MGKKFCSNCGSELQDNIRFCPKCGSPTSEDYGQMQNVEGVPKNHRKTLYALLAVIGIIIIIICGAIYYSDSQEREEIRLAREKFVKDSLEKARQDSINLAKLKEQERIEAERIAAMRNELSVDHVFALMNNINSKVLAKKCGLEEIYKYEYYYEGEEDEPGESCDVEIYGREVKKGSVSENGSYVDVEIIPNSDHSCYLKHSCSSDCSYLIAFKDYEDANYFFNKVTENGVIKSDGSYLIPKKRQFKGIRENYNWESDDIAYDMSEVENYDGWYTIRFGPYW